MRDVRGIPHRSNGRRAGILAAALLAPLLALSACADPEPEEQNLEVDVEDLSGGELEVRTPEEGEVPVTVPETQMTNVPVDQMGEATESAGDEEAAE